MDTPPLTLQKHHREVNREPWGVRASGPLVFAPLGWKACPQDGRVLGQEAASVTGSTLQRKRGRGLWVVSGALTPGPPLWGWPGLESLGLQDSWAGLARGQGHTDPGAAPDQFPETATRLAAPPPRVLSLARTPHALSSARLARLVGGRDGHSPVLLPTSPSPPPHPLLLLQEFSEHLLCAGDTNATTTQWSVPFLSQVLGQTQAPGAL